ncbi:MAG: DUF4142 domain-containing protein [Allosphingosinicella sp.]|uniref:DUF4142 domain-containing protein n=1 Tax=Allosphingosinicella sp. TaxID=2823234 RepID=UPI003963BBD5
MRIALMTAAAGALALAACGTGGDAGAANDQQVVPGEPVTNMQAEAVPAAVNAIEYANLVAASDRFEIESAEIAIERADNEEVRELARMILQDHRQSTERLRQAAAGAQIQLPAEPRLSEDQQRDLDALRGLSGADFDRTWTVQQVAAHEKAMGLVTGYLSTADNQAMADHANSVAGPINQHLIRARDLAKRLQEGGR